MLYYVEFVKLFADTRPKAISGMFITTEGNHRAAFLWALSVIQPKGMMDNEVVTNVYRVDEDGKIVDGELFMWYLPYGSDAEGSWISVDLYESQLVLTD